MNKLLLTATFLAASAAMDAQNYYSTDFSSEEEFGKWTVVDANADGATWKYDGDGSQSKVYYPYSATNQADDWLISPEITVPESGKVMVSYITYGTSYGESMEVYTGSGNTVGDMTERQASYDNIKGEATPGYFFLEVEKGKPFRVGFRATSAADHWKFYMCSFNVKRVEKVIDLKVSEILSPVSGKNLKDETVTVKIKNDGLETASGFDVAYETGGSEAVREHVDASLEAGKEMEYTFNAKVDLSIPHHNYILKAYTIDAYDIVPENDTLSVKVRHSAPVDAPYTMGFEPTEDTADFKFYNLNEDEGDWSVYSASSFFNMARTGYSCLAYNYDKTHNANDWAILDGINVEAGDYVLRYWYSGSDGHTEKLRVCYGNGDTPDDMTHVIDEQPAIQQGQYQESFKVVHFDAPQTIYLGFYAYSDKDENWLTIDDVQFYKASSDAVDLVVSEISAPFDYVRVPNDKDVSFVLKSVGIKDTKGTVHVYVDGVEKASSEMDIKAQQILSLTSPNVIKDLAAGKHTVKVSVVCADDNDDTNNAVEKDFTVLGTPAKLYDFEDAKVPEDLSFYVWDSGSVNPDAGEEFNEYGWGIIPLGSTHSMYGNSVFAGTSWIDNVSSADRWVILPQFKVNSENTYLVWDASSGNQNHLESYKVKVSDGSGNPADYWYSTETEIKNESVYPKTRGISLGKYAGKDIYVAFNLTTAIGDFLVLDNIGIYGDVTSGVRSVESVAGRPVVVSDNSISSEGAVSILVVDLGGRTVASADSDRIDIASLKAGVYVAKVNYSAGSQTLRFVKK